MILEQFLRSMVSSQSFRESLSLAGCLLQSSAVHRCWLSVLGVLTLRLGALWRVEEERIQAGSPRAEFSYRSVTAFATWHWAKQFRPCAQNEFLLWNSATLSTLLSNDMYHILPLWPFFCAQIKPFIQEHKLSIFYWSAKTREIWRTQLNILVKWKECRVPPISGDYVLKGNKEICNNNSIRGGERDGAI